tara:strand:- start:3209 stop:3394 length:186 start_codon:yes stop_codon:yes gene_type:complete
MKDRHATIANYAEAVVDGMDMKTLCAFAIDTIIENLEFCSDDDLIEMVKNYDEDNTLGIIE